MSELSAAAVPAQHPVRLRITDDLQRTRLTVAFRLILAIPHFVWVFLWGIAAVVVGLVNWVATLIKGRSPDSLQNFLAGFLRYTVHTGSYLFLIADPFPGFFKINMKDDYPIDLEVDPPEVQNRWTVGFRPLLAIPALIIAQILRQISEVLAIFSWFVALFTGRVPLGLRNFAAWALRYETQTYAYLGLLTPRYPNFDVNVTA